MKNLFYSIMIALSLTALPQYAYSIAPVSPLLKRQESLENLQKAAKEKIRSLKTDYIKIELEFFRMKKPKTGVLKFVSALTGYKKKYLILKNDLMEFKKMLMEGEKKLLAPFPTELTDQTIPKYQDNFVDFTNAATRTLPLLRDELKWAQGQKQAQYESFKNYKAADRLLSKKKVEKAY
ncbi:MAG TPA: hypothetical protein DD412_06800 [Holosporales bacterium]|nr:hypothetical protein [Holosporales bacterium]